MAQVRAQAMGWVQEEWDTPWRQVAEPSNPLHATMTIQHRCRCGRPMTLEADPDCPPDKLRMFLAAVRCAECLDAPVDATQSAVQKTISLESIQERVTRK